MNILIQKPISYLKFTEMLDLVKVIIFKIQENNQMFKHLEEHIINI